MDFEIYLYTNKLVGDPSAPGHLQLLCKDAKQNIIICRESGFQACEKTGLSAISGSQKPWL
jgi:hypothetical protein